ncbi:MAG: DUF1579 domain-containing protein [Pirellulaceae bacterium]
MFEKPQSEHNWLSQLVGDWVSESECQMGPDAPPEKSSGRMSCRMLGGLWLIAEGTGDMPEGEPMTSIITLGYDPVKGKYVGNFIASVMTHLWPYSGALDDSGKRLPLDSEGPRFDGVEGMAKYRDTIEIIDKDHWRFFGEMQVADGTWVRIMTSENRRA